MNFYFLQSSSDVDTLQFQLTMEIPKIKVRAQYRSSGVLILVQASGAGDYWGQYGKSKCNYLLSTQYKVCKISFSTAEGVKAKVYFKAVPQETIDDLTYLAVEQVKMDFSVKEINMGVENIANGNSIIRKLNSS